MPSPPQENDEFPNVFEGRMAARLEEQTRWAAAIKHRRAEFAKLRSLFEKERGAWDRNGVRMDARIVRAHIARAAPFLASVAEQTAAGQEGGLLEAALASVRGGYKARAADVASKERVAMDIASGRRGCPATLPPGAGASAPAASAAFAPQFHLEVAHAQDEEQNYLDRSAGRHFERFAALQYDFACSRAAWDCRAKLQDAAAVEECFARARPLDALAARAEAQREGDILASRLAAVRGEYRAREEEDAVDARRAMYNAIAWTDRWPAIPPAAA